MSHENPKRMKIEDTCESAADNTPKDPSNDSHVSELPVSPANLPAQRREKLPQTIPEPSKDVPHCQHWVTRKNRYCKMTIKNGAKYCGEHALADDQPVLDDKRIPCPLDPAHSVYAHKLKKHLEVCNVKKLEVTGSFVKKNINIGEIGSVDQDENFRLRDVPQSEMDKITEIVEKLFHDFVEDKIVNYIKSHKVLNEEMKKDEYGDDKLRHLVQTSSILGILDDNKLFVPDTCFIDLGAGKGNLSFWLSKAILEQNLQNSKVLVVDRASHRHKRDNLVKDTGVIDRLRVDIGDLDMKELDFNGAKCTVGVSKHLCGRATDFALRCLINGNKGPVKTKAFLICVCCHHQITFDSFVGRDWIIGHGIDRKTFNIIIKMVSWCVCGDGKSRDHHKEFGVYQDEKTKQRELIGWKCKRLLDYARVEYMREQGYETNLYYYVEKDQTLENVCIFGRMKE